MFLELPLRLDLGLDLLHVKWLQQRKQQIMVSFYTYLKVKLLQKLRIETIGKLWTEKQTKLYWNYSSRSWERSVNIYFRKITILTHFIKICDV